ncbi:MAG: PAS domain S-box protein [Methanomicrobiales archaeon]|nr:PAS domain S-box protein [Methanomicrobiales archaeon]
MLSVLLVDDDPALLEIARTHLAKNKEMGVDTAQSAAEALEKLNVVTYDVVVSDYDMPITTGIEFLKTLRSSGNLTPFIIFTGKGQEQVAMDAINNGADFYLIRAGDPKHEFIDLTHKIRKSVKQRRAEIEIRESEERLRKLLYSLPSGVLVIDAETHIIVQANPAALLMMGANEQDITGNSCFELVCPAEESQCPITDLGQKFESSERLLLRNDGTSIPVLISVARITLGNRQVLVETFTDLSAQKETEHELQKSREKYRHLIEQSNEAIVVAQDGVLRLANNKAVEFTGYSEQELLSMPFPVLIHPDDRAMVVDHYNERVKGGEAPSRYIFRLQPKDGSTRWVELSVSVIDWDRQPATLNFLTDITDRKRTEETLLQLTDRLSLATRAGGVGIWEQDLIKNTLTWDDQMFSLYGITREVFGGAYETWQGAIHPDDRQRCDAEHQRALRGETNYNTEFRILRPDGKTRSIRALALVQRDISGKPLRMVGTNWDITGQKKVERELHESRENYRTMVEEIHDMIWLSDTKGLLKYVSPRSTTLLGYQPEEMIGHLFSEFISLEDTKSVHNIFEKNFNEPEELHLIETHSLRKDGRIIILESSAVPYYAKNGTLVGYRGVSRDITEIKKSGELQSLLAAIVTSSDDAIVGEDSHHMVTTWNLGAERIYGYSREEMVGTDSYRIVPEVEKDALHNIIDRVLQGEPVEHFNTFRVKKDGSLVEISMSLSPILDDHGHIIGIAKIARDLTKQRETEKALLAYISETAMRLKIPVELIGGRLSEIQKQVLAGDVTPEELHLQLQIQVRNTEQIVSNLRELNMAISTGFSTIPEAYQDYLKR